MVSDPGSSVIPLSDEQAKAIQEALKTLRGIGGFLKQTFGTVPEDMIGLLGGDWLKARRMENFARIAGKAQRRLKLRNITSTIPPRLPILLPLVNAAADEEDDELQDLWARLLAAAADPARAKSFRAAFVNAAKKMDPLDAAALKALPTSHFNLGMYRSLSEQLGVSTDEIEISIDNLLSLGFVRPFGDVTSPTYRLVSPFAREFLRAIND
jgi:hypothetical protein